MFTQEESFVMNKEQLHRFVSESTGNESNICQIYAIKGGKTVYDDCWHGFKTLDAMNVNSVTKGMMGLLAGIALDGGYIKSVDQKVMSFFPDYTVKRGEKTIYDVTIRHLLTMTAPYKGKSEPWKRYVPLMTGHLRHSIILEDVKGSQANSDMPPLVFRSWQESSRERQEKNALILPTGNCLNHLGFQREYHTETAPKKISLISS